MARTGTTAGLAALAAGLTLGAGAPAGADLAVSTGSQGRLTGATVPAEPDTAPLRVRIGTMSKASLPAKGTLTIRGTVTNASDETWTTIKLYPFVGAGLTPMTDPSDLAAAMDVAYDAQVGERLVNVGEPGLVDVLEPGATARYVVKVPVSELGVPTGEDGAEGVYWFGVHALGQGGSLPRDNAADGRARTFLPYVPRRTDPVPAALVVPLTHAVLYDSDGALADEERWQQRLSPGGRLRDLLTLGQSGATAGVPITWLVDPALLDAIGRLASGNPPRSLEATPASAAATEPEDADTSDPADPSDTPTAEATPDDASPTADPDAEDPAPQSPAAQAAQDWLEAAGTVFDRGEVVTLPYGNPDVATTRRVAPGLLDLALAQRSTVLASLDAEPSPVLAAPGGFVDTTLTAAAPAGTPLLVSDRFLADPGPSVARLAGHPLVVTSSGAALGSPGPGRSVTAVGLRQRLLAEAAVRAIPTSEVVVTDDPTDPTDADPTDDAPPASATGQPLVVLLPTAWDLATAEELFDGLDPDWLRFGSLSAATSSTPAATLTADDLVDTSSTRRRELTPETFEAVQDLITTGDTLQRVLVDNARIGARVTEQALSGLSYSVRREERTARGSLALSRSWLEERLGSIGITASSGVTLSGDSGTFVVTLTNDLEESVTVSIASLSDDELDIDPVEPLTLGPQSRTSVLLNVTTTTGRVHTVTLMVTDAGGVPLGASDQLPIRSVLVSDVIWVIIGVGVGTLFIAIGLRLRRRIVASRRGETGSA